MTVSGEAFDSATVNRSSEGPELPSLTEALEIDTVGGAMTGGVTTGGVTTGSAPAMALCHLATVAGSRAMMLAALIWPRDTPSRV